jgi:hypothetical protein
MNVRSRFEFPEIQSVAVTELPDEFRKNPPPCDALETLGLGIVHVFALPAVLRIVTDKDAGRERRQWQVRAYYAITSSRADAFLATSSSDVAPGDTPDGVGDEFAKDLVQGISLALIDLVKEDDDA